MCILQLHCRYLELHKTGQLVILAAEKLRSSGAEEGVGQAEVFQSAVPDGAEEKCFSLEAQEGGVRSSEPETNFRECYPFCVPCEHGLLAVLVIKDDLDLKKQRMCLSVCDTAETDMLQLSSISQSCASLLPYEPAACFHFHLDG